MNLTLKTVLLTSLAMIAFAANSVIARQALLGPEIGPLSYTSIRLFSGALILAVLIGPFKSWKAGSWTGAIYLLAYAILFSLSYISLSAGIGALILCTSVQMTMVSSGLLSGEKLTLVQTSGAVLAFLGMVYLLNPGTDAPPFWGSILMVGSGVGWGLYSLKGRASQNPTGETGGNFIRASILTGVILLPYLLLNAEPSPKMSGVVLAIVSGAITSGLGYIIWYAALPYLSSVRAGLAQLTVPAIAAIGGVLFLAEPITVRLVISSLVILIGVGVATLPQGKQDG